MFPYAADTDEHRKVNSARKEQKEEKKNLQSN